VVEFLTYALPGEAPQELAARTPELIEGGTALCLQAGAKVLKIPYPGTARGCAAVTALAGPVPWAVLSAGCGPCDLPGAGRDGDGQRPPRA
jgi:tagatose 1,6-diphosphate aldolase